MAGMNLDQNLIERTKLRGNPKACIDTKIVQSCTEKLLQVPDYRREIGQNKHTFMLMEIPGLLGFKKRKKMMLWRVICLQWYKGDDRQTVEVFAEEDGRLLLTEADRVYQQKKYYVNRCEPAKLVRYLLETQSLLHANEVESPESLRVILKSDFDRVFEDYIVPDKSQSFSLNMVALRALQDLRDL